MPQSLRKGGHCRFEPYPTVPGVPLHSLVTISRKGDRHRSDQVVAISRAGIDNENLRWARGETDF